MGLMMSCEGGTGKRANWELAKITCQNFPTLLAGGLSSENVAKAIEIVKPFGIDVSSGVEDKPGIKSESKLREFFGILRGLGE